MDPDLYNVPAKEHVAGVTWLTSAEYPEIVVQDIIASIRKQDPQAEVLAIKFEGDPIIETAVRSDQTIRSQNLTFPVQLLVRHSSGGQWRHRANYTYSAEHTGDRQKVSFSGTVTSSEQLT